LEERLTSALRTTVQGKADMIVQKVEVIERGLFENLPFDDPAALRARLKAVEEEGLVEQVFVLNEAGEFVYPVMDLPPYTPPRAALPAEDEVHAQALLKDGYYKEFVKNDLPAALESYKEYKRMLINWYEGEKNKGLEAIDDPERHRLKGAVEAARAIQLVASCLFKMGRYDRCVREYWPLAYDPTYQKVAFDLSVLARYQIGQALYKMNNQEEAAAKLLDLYELLLTRRPRAGEAPLIAYFKKRVIEDLEAFQIHLPGTEAKARYEALKRNDTRLREQRRFLHNVKNWWGYRRGFLTKERPTDALKHDRIEPGMDFIAYKLHPVGTNYSLVGFKVDLNYVIEKIAFEVFEDEDFRKAADVSVIDEEGRLVYGVPRNSGGLEVGVAFPRIFRFWEIRAAENNPQAARKMARKLTAVYTILNLMIVGVIVAGVYLTIRDMNRELELTKMKSDFVSNVSHELKTPLALIRMFSETLLMGRVKEEARKREYYDVITRESERLTALINNVLDFSKIDAGRRTYDMGLVSVEEVIKNTVGAYRYELAKEDFEIEIDIEPGLPEVLMDDNAITQALLNLLNNAVKYSGDRKEIKISAKRRDGALHISVADSGIGISREDQRKIFDMFYRGSEESVRSTRGTGLGLAITKHTAEAHGGTVMVQSVKGRGSTFTIVLPIRQQAKEAQAPSEYRMSTQ